MANPIKAESASALITLTAQAAGVVNSPDLSPDFARGIVVGVNITSVAGGATLTVKVQGRDLATGVYYDLPSATTAALGAAAFTPLIVYPGITVAANSTINMVVPPTFRIVATVAVAPLAAATITVGFLI